jgi:outer membrane protein assembly factor BamB
MRMAQQVLAVAAAVCMVLAVSACTAGVRGANAAKSAGKLDLAARKPLYGGDPQAWLTHCGDNADSGFCQAKLRLPLAQVPEWTTVYSGAEFSRTSPVEIVHYDGELAISAKGPQLMLLNAKTGAKLFNEYLIEGKFDTNKNPQFGVLFIHPAGLLLARDQLNRAYCFDMQKGKLDRVWLNNESGASDDRVYVAQGSGVILGGAGRLRGAAIADGVEQWSYPSLLPNQGRVLSRDGVLVWWSNLGQAGALDAGSGELLWQVSINSGITRIIIDDRYSTFYLSRDDERLECRDLHTGQLRWEYSWANVLAPAKREQLIQRLRAAYKLPRLEVMLLCRDICCIPQGVCLCLISGEVLALSATGDLLWQVKMPEPVTSVVAFENGILITQEYSQLGGRRQVGEFMPFMLDAPDWPSYKQASAERQKQGRFNKLTVLDLKTGALLSSFEPPLAVSCWLVPAYNMVILGMEKDATVESSIRAYPWLEPQGF